VQITYNPETGRWHPHVHIAMEARYLWQRTISRLWHDVTGDSKIVDIRRIRDADYGARYVARYVGKPVVLSELPIVRRVEIIAALAGQHMYGAFGTACGAKVLSRPPFERADWQDVGTWGTVVGLLGSSETARTIWSCWRTHTPLPEGFDLSAVDLGIDLPGFSQDSSRSSSRVHCARIAPASPSLFPDDSPAYRG